MERLEIYDDYKELERINAKLREALTEALKVVSGDNTRKSNDVLREQWERLLSGRS